MEINETVKRFERIVAILIQLQSKRIVKARDLAERFEVSLRTIYRDIKTLENCGVPVLAEAGIGYSIMEGYRLPPVMFTKEEATSFVAAEKLMQHFTDTATGKHFSSAMYKIKSVLRWSEKDRMDILNTQIKVHTVHRLFNESVHNALEILMNAIINKIQVNITYQSWDAEAKAERQVEPIGVYHENSYWYLWAYCHLRKDYRRFRTDRIFNIFLSGNNFQLLHQPLDWYLEKEKHTGEKFLIRILVSNNMARYMGSSKNYYGFLSEKKTGDKVEMTFMAHETCEYFARWFLMFGDEAEIIEPVFLKDQVKKLAIAVAEKIK